MLSATKTRVFFAFKAVVVLTVVIGLVALSASHLQKYSGRVVAKVIDPGSSAHKSAEAEEANNPYLKFLIETHDKDLRKFLEDEEANNPYLKFLEDKPDTLPHVNKFPEVQIKSHHLNVALATLGLRPYANDPTPKEMVELVVLKVRIKDLAELQQHESNREFRSLEVRDLVSRETKKTVIVNPWYWSAKKVPVLRLSANQLRDVVVPEAERKKITQALRRMHYKNRENPLYLPTKETIRWLYLMGKSPAGVAVYRTVCNHCFFLEKCRCVP